MKNYVVQYQVNHLIGNSVVSAGSVEEALSFCSDWGKILEIFEVGESVWKGT